MTGMTESGVWRDAAELPETLAATLEQARGVAEVAALLRGAGRIVATGNGASYYVAQALWLASLAGPPGPQVLALPGGLVARGRFAWREGDVLLACSSSGEFRDVIEAIEGAPAPFALITATEDSTLARAAGPIARSVVRQQRGYTHTQAYCGAAVVALALWAQVTADAGLEAALAALPELLAPAVAEAPAWASGAADAVGTPRGGIAFGSGPAWPAALELALLLKEVPLIPFEGMETREGATTGMYALSAEQLAISLPTGEDPLIAEAEATCRAQGATVLALPAPAADPRLAIVSTFPAALALATELAVRAGLDPDEPAWRDAYLATARR